MRCLKSQKSAEYYLHHSERLQSEMGQSLCHKIVSLNASIKLFQDYESLSVRKVRTIFNLNIRGQLYPWEKELLHID